MKKLSIIIPAFNSEKYIEKCINSILMQKYVNLEIIIVDDHSNDNTYEICKNIEKIDKRVKTYRNDRNRGVSYSRNLGIDYAMGEYITFVDADDYIKEDMYNIMIEKLETYNFSLIMCNFLEEKHGKDIRNDIKKQDIVFSKKDLMNNVFLSDYYCGFVWNKIYISKIIKNNNIRFNEEIYICEDLLFNCEYISNIEKGCYITDKLYYYIQRDNSSYNNNYNYKWKTVILAYQKMRSLIYEENIDNFQYSYLYSLLNLKEKIYLAQIKDRNLIKEVNKNILENKNGIYNKNISKTLQIKLWVKTYMMWIFIALKIILKNIKSIVKRKSDKLEGDRNL